MPEGKGEASSALFHSQYVADPAAPLPARWGPRAAAAGAALTRYGAGGARSAGAGGEGAPVAAEVRAGHASPAATPGPGHEEGRARRQSHAVPAATGRGRLTPRESEERLREELREPLAAGPSARLLLPPLPLLQRGAAAAAAGLPPAAAALPLLQGAPRAGRPSRLCPRPAARLGDRELGCQGCPAVDPAASLLAQPQPPLQHRLCLLLPHLLPDPGQAGPQRWPEQRRRLLVAAGAARVLLPGGLLGVAVVVLDLRGRRRRGSGPAHAPGGGGGGQVVLGAELCGLADARAPGEAAAQHPGAALLQLGLVGLRH